MPKRFLSIWFRYLLTDWKLVRQPALVGVPVAFAEPDHGRLLITAVNRHAEHFGVSQGMTAADAEVIAPNIQIFDGKPGHHLKLLNGLAEWCLRYSPIVALDPPGGLFLDVTGCTHLKGGEEPYVRDLASRLLQLGYVIHAGMADTIGCAWAVARSDNSPLVVPAGGHRNALIPLPPAALRLSADNVSKLQELGFYRIADFIHMPPSVLKRRFGPNMVLRLHQALGKEEEFLLPLKEPVPYTERYACLEPVRTREAIENAVYIVIDQLCKRLYGEGLGLRSATLTYLRVDGKSGRLPIGTNHPSQRTDHIFKLFCLQLDQVEPALGIELFILDATKTEPAIDKQSGLWLAKPGAGSEQIGELLDNIIARVGADAINRYLPYESHMPERAQLRTDNLDTAAETEWRDDLPRPVQLLKPPEPVEAMALTPDYPPKQFVWRREKHIIVGANGPERIEAEWWGQGEGYRDYYVLEDEGGNRYWVFSDADKRWFLHGFFP